jgi:hypothetical protein
MGMMSFILLVRSRSQGEIIEMSFVLPLIKYKRRENKEMKEE